MEKEERQNGVSEIKRLLHPDPPRQRPSSGRIIPLLLSFGGRNLPIRYGAVSFPDGIRGAVSRFTEIMDSIIIVESTIMIVGTTTTTE